MTPHELADALDACANIETVPLDGADQDTLRSAARLLRELEVVRVAAGDLDFAHTEECAAKIKYRKQASGDPWPCTCGMNALRTALGLVGGG